MTYCVAMNLEQGLVFASDSRTSAGTDYVTTYSKMHIFSPSNDRFFVLLSAGNLATTQEVINRIHRDLDKQDGRESLMTTSYMFEAADYVGRVSQEVQQLHHASLQQAGISGETSWILGGQILGQPPSLKMIYPQGNYIESSEATPFLQIGETKYGKPVLDRVINFNTPLNDAGKLALISLSSTSNSNISVGAPFELAVYHTDSFQLGQRCKFEANSEYLTRLETIWKDGLNSVFQQIPDIDDNGPVQESLSLQQQSANVTPVVMTEQVKVSQG